MKFTLHHHIRRHYVFLMGHVMRLSSRTYKGYAQYKFKKTTLFLISIAAAYILFSDPTVRHFIKGLSVEGYLGFLFAGMMFPFGFTASFAVGFFLLAGGNFNPFIGALIAGAGSYLADIAIFRFISVSFKEEINELRKSKIFKNFRNFFEKNIPAKIDAYLTVIFAGLLIGTPLPDEIGIAVLAGFTEIKETTIMILSYVLNTLGIFVILLLAHLGL